MLGVLDVYPQNADTLSRAVLLSSPMTRTFQVGEMFDLHATVSSCAQMTIYVEGDVRRGALSVLSYLAASYARPSPEECVKRLSA